MPGRRFSFFVHPISYNLSVRKGTFFALLPWAMLGAAVLSSVASLRHAFPSIASDRRNLHGYAAGWRSAAAPGSASIQVPRRLAARLVGQPGSGCLCDRSQLNLEVASVGAHYEAKVSADHKLIDGTWSQGEATLPLVFRREPPAHKPIDAVSPVEGLWQSALDMHGLRLRLQLHVSHDTEGQLIGALDNLDQGVTGLPAVDVTQKDSAVHFEIPAVGATFDGTLNAGKNAVAGEWSMGSTTEKLEFKRSDQPLELRRPQTPAKPYPYREDEVSFRNEAADVTLAGTLTLPRAAGPFPAALLIAGSGPYDRDESVANHKPFLVLSDYLTRKGIAVLRYDKRGAGKSTGSADRATTLDLANDAQAAIRFLRTRKEIDASRLGLIGHSEGAIIAPYIAAHSKELPWLVLLAAPATKGQDTFLNQSELIGRA